ncbi:MAG: hypothetical protein ACI30J_05360 [Paludibacteraceae bacterium]
MKKLTLLLSAMLLAWATNLWAATAEVKISSFSALSGSIGEGSVGISYEAAQGGAGTAPAVNSNQIRLYQVGTKDVTGGRLILTSTTYPIVKVQIKSSMATTVGYREGVSDTVSTTLATEYTANGKSATITANSYYTADSLNCNVITLACLGSGSKARIYLSEIIVTYEYSDTEASIICDKTIDFGVVANIANPIPTDSLKVTAKNLTEDIAVTLSENAAFTLSTTTLPAEGGTLVITPMLTVGENTATLTLTSGETSVEVALSATIKRAYTVSWVVNGETYTMGGPTTIVIEDETVTTLPIAPADNTLSCSNIFVGWSPSNIGSTAGQTQPEDLFALAENAPAVTENTTYHAVFATADGEAKEYFKETFNSNKSTGGNDNVWKGITVTDDITSDSLGWAFENGYAASACIRIGKSKAQGSATTPALTGLTGNAVLTFRAGAWDGDATTLNLSITPETATPSEYSVTLSNAAFSTYTINITNATEGATITFHGAQTNNARFFLDDVVVKNAVTLKDFRTNCEGVSTAVDNAALETSVVKTIENGQLVILRDGVKYNAMGVRLQ